VRIEGPAVAQHPEEALGDARFRRAASPCLRRVCHWRRPCGLRGISRSCSRWRKDRAGDAGLDENWRVLLQPFNWYVYVSGGRFSLIDSSGGIGKGIMVREIDALDGLCGKVTGSISLFFEPSLCRQVWYCFPSSQSQKGRRSLGNSTSRIQN
jgi:hypothetical protein